jgi:hypothetical protein
MKLSADLAAAASHTPHLDQTDHENQHAQQQRPRQHQPCQGNRHIHGHLKSLLPPNFSRTEKQASFRFVLKTILALESLGLVLGFTGDKGKYKWDMIKRVNTIIIKSHPVAIKLVFHFTVLGSHLQTGTTIQLSLLAAYGCQVYY